MFDERTHTIDGIDPEIWDLIRRAAINEAERPAVYQVKGLLGAEAANAQPHSGAVGTRCPRGAAHALPTSSGLPLKGPT